MSPSRPPSAPPELPDFDFVKLLGSGGFADVFLYHQHLPERDVAVKVLLPDAVGQDKTAQFVSEANVMAQLSTHPSIVTIYQAGVATDGRSYLVMEYCPRANLQKRYRTERISVAEALRIGIQVSGAVETAHRAGILHRDIKPANILVTQYNRPALTDFGISANITESGEESQGMSIPWSPPEFFESPARSFPTSDVWALGATVYSLLAARSPFEIPGGTNGAGNLIQRVQSTPLPPTARADVPASLERVLSVAMAKNLSARYASAIQFARALQRVEIELGFSATPIDVMDDGEGAGRDSDDDGGLTRIRSVTSIDAQGSADQTSRSEASSQGSFVSSVPGRSLPGTSATGSRDGTGTANWQPAQSDNTRRITDAGAAADHSALKYTPPPGFSPGQLPGSIDGHTLGADTVGATQIARPPAIPLQPQGAPGGAGETVPMRRRTGLWVTLSAVVLVVVVGIATASLVLPRGGHGTTAATASSKPQNPITLNAPTPTELKGVLSESKTEATFTWKNPDPQPGDRFLWGVASQLGQAPALSHEVTATTVTVPAVQGGQTCLVIELARANGLSSPATQAVCAT